MWWCPWPYSSISRLDNSNLYLCKFKWKFYERPTLLDVNENEWWWWRGAELREFSSQNGIYVKHLKFQPFADDGISKQPNIFTSSFYREFRLMEWIRSTFYGWLNNVVAINALWKAHCWAINSIFLPNCLLFRMTESQTNVRRWIIFDRAIQLKLFQVFA